MTDSDGKGRIQHAVDVFKQHKKFEKMELDIETVIDGCKVEGNIVVEEND